MLIFSCPLVLAAAAAAAAAQAAHDPNRRQRQKGKRTRGGLPTPIENQRRAFTLEQKIAAVELARTR